MTYEERKEKIIEWLKDNDIFEKFICNLLDQKSSYNPFTEQELDAFLLSKSFSWMHTPEGLNFWKSIDKKYYEFYGNLTTNKTTKMEEKSVKINIPEGYEIDKEKSNLTQIIFKKKEAESWQKGSHNVDGYYIDECSAINPISDVRWISTKFNVFATKKQAKSALAMAQISQIMTNDERFGGSISDEEWKDNNIIKYVIIRSDENITEVMCWRTYAFLAFHTEEQRNLFIKENKDLVKQYLMID